MRKFVDLLLLLLFLSFISFAQDASSYFPANPGFTWNFKVVPLDSANNEMDSLTYYRIDSFAVTQDYKGMPANVIISKVGIFPGLPFTPVSDTSYISLNGSDAYTYYKLFNIDSLISSLGSSKILSKINSMKDVSGWFSYYHFAQSENQSYPIFSLDTAISYNGNSLSIRYEVKGIRLADQIIWIDNNNYNCKKFVINNSVSYLLAPTLPLPLFTISDTVWIAPNQWIVKDVIPSTNVDLSAIQIGKLFIPGSNRVLVSQIPTGINYVETKVNEFKLYQNYPNPFNPSTTISYSLPENSNVELTIYDVLGNKVTTLINKEQNAGNHEVKFNPSLINGGISSGVYFYNLKAGTELLTKKLIYLK
ncbi:MAG: T9SS type A sorting domain-containing protein [Ignavibacteriaceae bacterium]